MVHFDRKSRYIGFMQQPIFFNQQGKWQYTLNQCYLILNNLFILWKTFYTKWRGKQGVY
jgi:hypothetical protein